MSFNLAKFEHLTYNRKYEDAGRELLGLLRQLDGNYGVLDSQFEATAQSSLAANAVDEHLLARLVSALTALSVDSEFQLSDVGFSNLLNFHRWLSSIFAASPFRNADHILRALSTNGPDSNELQVSQRDLRKFALFYLTESELPVDVDALWNFDKKLMAGLAMTLISPRFLGTPAAHTKREVLLKWLPNKLAEVALDDLPGGILHDVYMHCSYADYEGKHDIKKPINALIRRKLRDRDLIDSERDAKRPAKGKKPVVVVVLEWFTANHSIYRTHSHTIDGMRRHFHVVGMGYKERVDDVTRRVFDEFVEFSSADVWPAVSQVKQLCDQRLAQICYMPSVGMFPLTMILSNLRVAPLQAMALGHPATTHADTMDYVVVEEDYVGDEACFSEQLLVLPRDGMPYREPSGMKDLKLTPTLPPNPDVVRIVVAATVMKLNPKFLEACAQIATRATKPVHFHFLAGQAIGLVFPQVQRLIHRYLGDKATVHQHQAYDRYMNLIASCDLFLNPFPFGNTNGIVDTVYAGLVGICKTGREVHEHIDEGMFKRLNFPEWLIASTVDEYVTSALRLVEDKNERAQLSTSLAGPAAIKNIIFAGRPNILGDRLKTIWEESLGQKATSRKVTRRPSAEALPNVQAV